MRIEEYLKLEKLNVVEPGVDKMWEGLLEKRNRKKRRKLVWIKSVAAIIVASLFISVLVRQEMMLQKQITSLSQINETLRNQENDYVIQVSNKWESYVNMDGKESTATPMLMDELKCLDTLYHNGMNDLLKYGYNERLVNHLMNTYEKRLRIIEYLILEKQKQRNYERKVQKMDV